MRDARPDLEAGGFDAERWRRQLRVALGAEPADVVLRGGDVVDVFGGETFRADVAIAGGVIAAVGHYPDAREVIDVAGKTIAPSFIDAHVHTMMESLPLMKGLAADIGYANLVAARAAEKQLLRGFTSVRDMGGASLSLKQAIDEGLAAGPRIYPSGATISRSSRSV